MREVWKIATNIYGNQVNSLSTYKDTDLTCIFLIFVMNY